MFKIENDEIHLTRGDKCIIGLSISDYTFKQGDYILFKIYRKKELNKESVLSKKVTVDAETTEVEINLTSEETRVGEPANKAEEYWYEIELNGEQTIIGYDENVPEFNCPNMTSTSGMFSGCGSLTEQSLNNILGTCITMTKISSSEKTLKNIGLTSSQATTCQGLSNYQAFLDAGWTTGY